MKKIESSKSAISKIKQWNDNLLESRKMKEYAYLHEPDREKFTLLLSGLSTLRKTPGISEQMGYDKLYRCDSEENANKVRRHLEKLFGITDLDSLKEVCANLYFAGGQYEQMMTFWSKVPLFNPDELNQEAYKSFCTCMEYARPFFPLVKEKGFYAWDIDQRIGLCRRAVACGILSDEQFWEMTDPWVRQAQVFYHSFEEYALSSVCGALYDMERYGDNSSDYIDLVLQLVDLLLQEGGPWQTNSWYQPEQREWADLLAPGWNGGCFATKKALDTGCINYMYREEPLEGYPDSGWRFYAGDESQEYIDNPDNTVVVGLNTICNLWPDVLAYVYADVNRSFERQEDGSWLEITE